MRGRASVAAAVADELLTPASPGDRTRLQALLLFTLLALPVTFQPDVPKKGRKKKNPEHFADTLDAAMLLDFLTDRLQIWRVMQDVGDLAFASDVPLVEKEAKVKFVPLEERDAVQVWWADIVEPLCVSSALSAFESLFPDHTHEPPASAPMSTPPSSRTTVSSFSPPQPLKLSVSPSASSPLPRPSRRARSSRSKSRRGAASSARASVASPRARR